MTSTFNYCLATLVLFTVWLVLCYSFCICFDPSWSTAERERLLREAPHLEPTNLEMQQKHTELLSRAADLQIVMKDYGALRAHLSKESREGLGPDLPTWDFGAALEQAMKPQTRKLSPPSDLEVEQMVELTATAFTLTLFVWATMCMIRRGGDTTLVVALLWRIIFVAPFMRAIMLTMHSVAEAKRAGFFGG
ncbi:hypothetical protein LTR97_007775 [Elasticomyces elasticus]|uniref:Uncharacterized protein n=1 Tax=Elasticomyces elasticus TaxID=574655 RepID=A0AAN7VP87_9PEZI|nr:hypothetical protein LTR97_007775 [Elasticomyces elasticus]